VYLLLFNLICTWGKLSVVDEQHIKMTKVSQLLENQEIIVSKLKQLSREEAGVAFGPLKKKYKRDWDTNRQQVMRDSGMRITAVMQGKDPEQFIQEIKDRQSAMQQKAGKARKWVVLAVIAFIAYKKLF
jgi:hypothetical protein